MMNSIQKLVKVCKSYVKTSIHQTKETYSFLKDNYKDGQFNWHCLDTNTIGSSSINGKPVQLTEFEFLFALSGQTHMPSAICMGNPVGYIIFVNKEWSNSPQNVKEAIISHELGHIVEGHLDDVKASWKSLLGRIIGTQESINKELIADSYANPEGLLSALEQINSYYIQMDIVGTEGQQRLDACRERIIRTSIQEVGIPGAWKRMKSIFQGR